MFDDLKKKLTSNWSLMRIIRLGLAVMILIEAFKNYDVLFGIIGIVLLAQVALNAGCCGVSGCDIDHVKSQDRSVPEQLIETTFKEVK